VIPIIGAANWIALAAHFLSLSLLSVGGVLVTAPEMHRFLVEEQRWLTDPQFAASIALAQAAPGPNVLFVGLLGWNIGINANGMAGGPHSLWSAAFGMITALLSILAPSAVLAYFAGQWVHRNRHLRHVRAFKSGMAPIVVALLLTSAWLVTGMQNQDTRLATYLLVGTSTVIVWRTRIHMLWLLVAGACLGALGIV
jgi:chromate transporter